ncbi:MAG: transglutaminase-like cysteine peptidase [Dongiaceae bacterium]
MGRHPKPVHLLSRLLARHSIAIFICFALILQCLGVAAADLHTNVTLFNDSMFAGREKLKVPSTAALPLWLPIRAFMLDRRSAQRPGMREWARWVIGLKQRPLREKLAAINRRVNGGFHHESDGNLWRKDDYWEDPVEAVRRGGIDCEGYAIFKMYLAFLAGVPLTDMAIAVGWLSYRDGMHAVLVITDGRRTFVLDNLQLPVVEPGQIRDFQPAALIGLDEAWLIPRNLPQ